MSDSEYDRIVIGGGIFGAYAALLLGQKGLKVLLVEQGPGLMMRASLVNQARLHTGLHYPRSFLTALDSARFHKSFREKFSPSIFDVNHIYAISRFNSKTSAAEFELFIKRLGVDFVEIDPSKYFIQGKISAAFLLNEPTFDISIIRALLLKEFENFENIQIELNQPVTSGKLSSTVSHIELGNRRRLECNGVIIATYAGTNSLRKVLGLSQLPLTFEMTEVVLGTVAPEMKNTGITVMDGPFWSMMPFGNTGLTSLTSVGITPLLKANKFPIFECQKRRTGCTPLALGDCNSCIVKPKSGRSHQIQQMQMFMKRQDVFRPTGSLTTIKSILSTSEVDDSRPTLIHKESDSNTWTIFSGKISTLIDLEGIID